MTMIDCGTAALRNLCGGAVALPGDDGYDAARQAFNLAVDQRPAAVALPITDADVVEVVNLAGRARRADLQRLERVDGDPSATDRRPPSVCGTTSQRAAR
jgi:hypothetical protein